MLPLFSERLFPLFDVPLCEAHSYPDVSWAKCCILENKIQYVSPFIGCEMHYSSFRLELLAEVINVASWIRISVNKEWTSKVPKYIIFCRTVEKLGFNFRILFLCGYMVILLLILTAGWKFLAQKRYYGYFNWKDLPINPNALNIQSLHSMFVFSRPISRTICFAHVKWIHRKK